MKKQIKDIIIRMDISQKRVAEILETKQGNRNDLSMNSEKGEKIDKTEIV